MWQSVLKALGLILLDLGMLACLLAVPIGLPGNWVLLGLALLAAWAGHFQAIGWLTLAVMAGLVVLAEVVEAFLGAAMTRRYGASWWGALGAFAGGILGVILGTLALPVLGSVAGAFLGAAAGAAALEAWRLRRMDGEAMRAGWGAFVGKVLAALFKSAVGVGIAIVVVMRTH
ncbi:MAG: DUF456 domain-containing protein [Candidatus Krumholzibacteriota bacterium]|nr:DUF456 domain-containing protein [Candidatus Krumholzibacteriota bacterium]